MCPKCFGGEHGERRFESERGKRIRSSQGDVRPRPFGGRGKGTLVCVASPQRRRAFQRRARGRIRLAQHYSGSKAGTPNGPQARPAVQGGAGAILRVRRDEARSTSATIGAGHHAFGPGPMIRPRPFHSPLFTELPRGRERERGREGERARERGGGERDRERES